MKLYKYRSLQNLWHALDIIINQRIYCADWVSLNDPLEGRYEIFLPGDNTSDRTLMLDSIEKARDRYRIGSLSADPRNFLMWSHYSNGHKGIVIECEIPDDTPELFEVFYSPFLSVFSEIEHVRVDMSHIFKGKSEEWSYEKEYRIITEQKYFQLKNPIERIFLGPFVSKDQEFILRKILPQTVEIMPMRLDKIQGTVGF